MLIYVSDNKEAREFDFLIQVHNKLSQRFQKEIDTLKPVNLLDLNQYLAQVFHLSKQQTKIIINQLSERNLCEIRRGSGNAHYFVIIKKECLA